MGREPTTALEPNQMLQLQPEIARLEGEKEFLVKDRKELEKENETLKTEVTNLSHAHERCNQIVNPNGQL